MTLRRIALAAAAAFVVFALVVLVPYRGRVDLVESNRAGCERAKIDRTQNALGWRTAAAARRRTARDPDVANAERAGARRAAQRYARIASDLESRTGTRLDCDVVYPAPRLIG